MVLTIRRSVHTPPPAIDMTLTHTTTTAAIVLVVRLILPRDCRAQTPHLCLLYLLLPLPFD